MESSARLPTPEVWGLAEMPWRGRNRTYTPNLERSPRRSRSRVPTGGLRLPANLRNWRLLSGLGGVLPVRRTASTPEEPAEVADDGTGPGPQSCGAVYDRAVTTELERSDMRTSFHFWKRCGSLRFALSKFPSFPPCLATLLKGEERLFKKLNLLSPLFWQTRYLRATLNL